MAHDSRIPRCSCALALALATFFAATPLAVRGAAAPAAPEPALVALCRAWNAVRFFHPALQDETDGKWDDAFLGSVPAIERDPVSLSAAADAMLSTLHDPLTQIGAGPAPGAFGLPSSEVRDGIRVVHLNGYPSDDRRYYLFRATGITPMLLQLISIYACFYYLGSLTRYRPANFRALIDDRKSGPAIVEFLYNQPMQFLYLFASIFARQEVTRAAIV